MRILACIFVLLIVALQFPMWLGKGGWLQVHEYDRQVTQQRAVNATLKARNDALDADVLSIEDARSEGALRKTLGGYRYSRQVGPGVYDVHSPRIPASAPIVERLHATLATLGQDQVWVNPDCGLKTRTYAEILPALTNMVQAAHTVRAEIARRVPTCE